MDRLVLTGFVFVAAIVGLIALERLHTLGATVTAPFAAAAAR